LRNLENPTPIKSEYEYAYEYEKGKMLVNVLSILERV
jgi:hypothetical protein